MSKKIFSLFLISTVFVVTGTTAQNSSNISNAQLAQVMSAAFQRGMSQQEVAIYAKSKGYSDADIRLLMQQSTTLNSADVTASGTLNGNLAQRQTVQFGSNDPLNLGLDSLPKITNEESKIFGYAVFHNRGMSFTPNLNMATPKDYVIGPGDELVVQIYGISQATINLKVSPEGKVVIPNVGVSHISGLSIEAAKGLLTQRIGTRYAGFGGSNPSSFLMVTLSNVRSIKVNIVGEVKNPGTYQLPSFTTSFNALYAAGGPTTKGSFRNIQVFRAGKQIAEVDVYDFLLNGKTDKNIRLEDNDVLLIPQYGKRVEIVGEVRRNLLFEVKDKETVANLIEMANGFTLNAYRKMVTIQRTNMSDKSILNINENEQSTTYLSDGDYVVVGKTPNIYKNRIQILGAVMREGDYELQPNTRIYDVINLAGGLKADAFRSRAILYRTETNLQKTALSIDLNKVLEKDPLNNMLLNKEDLLVISSIYDIKENYFVTIQGEVNQTGTFPYSKGMTIGELVLQAKGFKEAASGSSIEIVRKVRDNQSEIAKIIRLDINKDLKIKDENPNYTLEPFDQVFVRASVGFKEPKKVYIQGEANFTGTFVMDKVNMTVGELIKRAGGVLPSANINGAILIRRTIFYKNNDNENDHLKSLIELRNRYIDSTKSGYNESNKVELVNLNNKIEEIYNRKFLKSYLDSQDPNNLYDLKSSSKDSVKKQNSKNENIFFEEKNIDNLKKSLQANILKNLRDVDVKEDQFQFVSIDLGKIIDEKSTKKFDIQLQEGDILFIPTYNETVNVSGDVLYPVVVKYIEGVSLKNYVNRAGGFNNSALRGKSYVVAANGSVKRTHSFLGIKFYPIVSPGSTVFVPKNNKTINNFSIDRVLGVISSLVTTYILVKNLSK